MVNGDMARVISVSDPSRLEGQSEAARRGLSTTGTLGVLLDAGEAGLIDPPQAYRRLTGETTFRTSPALEGHVLRRFV